MIVSPPSYSWTVRERESFDINISWGWWHWCHEIIPPAFFFSVWYPFLFCVIRECAYTEVIMYNLSKGCGWKIIDPRPVDPAATSHRECDYILSSIGLLWMTPVIDVWFEINRPVSRTVISIDIFMKFVPYVQRLSLSGQDKDSDKKTK